MSQPVNIVFYSEQKDGDQRVASEFTVSGTSYQKGNYHYFKFEEKHEGIDPISTIVKVNEKSCTIIRKGSVTMNHKYIPYQPTSSIYESPHGIWDLETVTNEMTFEWDEDKKKGRLIISYELFIQNQYVSEHEISLDIQAEEKVVH